MNRERYTYKIKIGYVNDDAVNKMLSDEFNEAVMTTAVMQPDEFNEGEEDVKEERYGTGATIRVL